MDYNEQIRRQFKKLERADAESVDKLFATIYENIMRGFLSAYEGLQSQTPLSRTQSYELSYQIASLDFWRYVSAQLNDPLLKEWLDNAMEARGRLGLIGEHYNIEMQTGVSVLMPPINEYTLTALLTSGSNRDRYADALYKYTDRIGQELRDIMLKGTLAGQDSRWVAQRAQERLGMSYRQAKNVARTECARVYSTARQVRIREGLDLGLTGSKEWWATHDHKTRKDHQQLDGQEADAMGEFEIAGHKAQGPHQFGIASEDCGCRCDVRVHWDRIERTPEMQYDYRIGESIRRVPFSQWVAEHPDM